MRRSIAELLNALGSRSVDKGNRDRGRSLYRSAARVDPHWSTPWYNLGLDHKNCREWEESLRCNQRAVEIDPQNEAGWWNLGIAATALRNWPEARRAWHTYGVRLSNEEGEVRMPEVVGCVRLDPNDCGEVVWGLRIDPARIIVLNVPLPESGHRFQDIILNDGAPNGKRVNASGIEVAVFDELAIWEASSYSTYTVNLRCPNEGAERHLEMLCGERKLGLEDWSTVRFMCKRCSLGNPGPHECAAMPLENGSRKFGFAAQTQEDLLGLLTEWAIDNLEAEFSEPQLLVPAQPKLMA